MNWQTYTEKAWETCQYTEITPEVRTILSLKLLGEIGEVADLLGKIERNTYAPQHVGTLYKTTEEYRADLFYELGDVCWYLAILGAKPSENALRISTVNRHIFLAGIYAGRYGITPDSKIVDYVYQDIMGLIHTLGFGIDAVLEANIEKLKARYNGN